MIKFADLYITQFISWLNDTYPTQEGIHMCIMYGFDCVEGPDGSRGFACYDVQNRVIYCADPDAMQATLQLTDAEIRKSVLINIAHELRHHMQFCNGMGAAHTEAALEKDAEEFAEQAVVEYTRLKQGGLA